ncbi:hypothetical protein AVM15_17540 [Paraclostridium benzoelyticum]|nr:hypothetical protein AVM15_17540 [Paraclostridium benzoelyticum]
MKLMFEQIFLTNRFNLSTIIPIVISIISLILSIITYMRNVKSEKFKIDFEMVKWFGSGEKGYPIYLWLNIVNYSKLPCSILEIKIRITKNGEIKEFSGTGGKKLITTITSNPSKNQRKIYSIGYPLNIAPYSCIGGYFHISIDEISTVYEDKTVEVIVVTNRGKEEKNLFLDFGKNVVRNLEYESGRHNIVERSDGTKIHYLIDKDID